MPLSPTRLEDRTVPAYLLPTTYAAGEDTASAGAAVYNDPTGIRLRTGDPSLSSPYAEALADDGSTEFSVGLGSAFSGGARVARADVTGDRVDDLIVGSAPGVSNRVRIYDGATHGLLLDTQPFEPAFAGGVYVTAGDLTGDGTAELVVTPDEGGGPRVSVFRVTVSPVLGQGNVAHLSVLADFFGIDDPNFRGGARATVADFNRDSAGDLVVAAGFGGGPRVAVFDGAAVAAGAPRKLFNDVFVFESTLRNGAYVAAGDLDGDGAADLIAGGGPGGGPRVLVLSGAELLAGRSTPVANFFAGDPAGRTGVRLAAKNLDGDAFADVVTGAGSGGGSRVAVYAGATLRAGGTAPVRAGDVFPSYSFTDGVYVG